MEQTGIYNNHLTSTLFSLKAFIWVKKAIQIKRSSGLQRGKSDKVDAQRIALFAYRNQDQKKLWEPEKNNYSTTEKAYYSKRKITFNSCSTAKTYTRIKRV